MESGSGHEYSICGRFLELLDSGRWIGRLTSPVELLSSGPAALEPWSGWASRLFLFLNHAHGQFFQDSRFQVDGWNCCHLVVVQGFVGSRDKRGFVPECDFHY